jgi:hypothetical protein
MSRASFGSTVTVLPTKTIKILPTADVTVIGWINGDAITLTSAGVNTTLILTLAQPMACDALLNNWSQGNKTLINSAADLLYANQFLIKGSANSPPPATIDPAAVEAVGDYRLFNRLQAAYRVANGQVTGTPKFLQMEAKVGVTRDPCPFSPIYAAGQADTGRNGANGATASGSGVFQLNEGRIGPLGQAVNLTLNGHTTPWIWSVIKFDTTGNLVFPFSIGAFPNPQIYPTYSVYKNGQLLPPVITPGDLQTFINLTDTSEITNAGSSQIP